jgi:Pyruvate/2-oxoacid:ferredoxin oxidoreductase gamma subunit
MKTLENKTKNIKTVIVHDGKEVIEELELEEGTTVITNADIIEGSEKERKDKVKELKLKEKVKDSKQ